MRDHRDMSHRPENTIHRRSGCVPARLLGGQLFFARSCELIDTCPPAAILADPLGTNPSILLHAMESRIERTLLGTQHVTGQLADRSHDGIAVQAGPAGKNFQNQQIERTLQRIRLRHIKTSIYRRLNILVKPGFALGNKFGCWTLASQTRRANYCSFAYSAFACLSTEISGSA